MNKYRKTITAVVGAAIASMPLLAGGITLVEGTAIVTFFAVAFGVYKVPNDR